MKFHREMRAGMTYYTVERVHAPCGSREAALFRLTYQHEWRSEIQQWCDLKVAEEELGPDPLGAAIGSLTDNWNLRSAS